MNYKRHFKPISFLFFAWVLLLGGAGCSQPAPRDIPTPADVTYQEPHRPQYHFSQPAMWMNDPNGLVYYQGEYHLFYQYYPSDTIWGPMHWGHAVSRDLVHWDHLPVALYPDDLGYIFSGSAVVDWQNTSGFGKDGEPPLVAIFTYHNPELAKAKGKNHEYQGIAFSNDRGRSWTKYSENPVLPNTQKLQDFRDPKVFWHERSNRWVMALSATDHVQFWASGNLREWRKLSEFGREWGAHGGVWECPDLVEMPVAGTPDTRWVLLLNLNPGGPQGGSGTQYFVGDFDGTTFTLDDGFRQTLETREAVWLDSGKDNYAGVTWADIPEEDGRTLFIGWMGNWEYAQQVPTWPWRSAMTLPRELTLAKIGDNYRVLSRPVDELAQLRSGTWRVESRLLADGETVPLPTPFPIATSEVILELQLPADGRQVVSVELTNEIGEMYRIGYDGFTNEFFSDRTSSGISGFSDQFAGVHRSPRLTRDRRLRFHIFFDVASAELFADGGANVMTELFFPSRPFSQLSIRADGQDVELSRATVYQLESIWR